MQQRNYREYDVVRTDASRAFARHTTDAQIAWIHTAFAHRYDLLADEGDAMERRGG